MVDFRDTTKARAARAARLEYLRKLGSGEYSLRETLVEVPHVIRRVSVWMLLTKTNKIGKITAETILEEAGVFPQLALGVLTEKERQALIKALPKAVR